MAVTGNRARRLEEGTGIGIGSPMAASGGGVNPAPSRIPPFAQDSPTADTEHSQTSHTITLSNTGPAP